jgi:kinetochore protein Spc7/SPC105
VALRTEEEQQAAAREREERERAQLEQEIKDRKEARRKSLAQRRVSFAAEATLHTFHEIEEMQDSTTSTDSTRRASSITGQASAPQHSQQPGSDALSALPDHAEGYAAESSAHHGDLHKKKRRRSSVASSAYGSDDTVASSVYDSDYDHADSVAEIQEMSGSSESEESDEDGTAMTVEAEEMTSASMASAMSAFSGDTTGSLDENLRLAARMAVTQSIDEDEEVIAGFAGWGRKNPSQENLSQGNARENNPPDGDADNQGDDDAEMEMEVDEDMDMTKAVGGILYPQLPSPDKDDEVDEEMSMDVTTALGGILSKAKAFLRRKSVNPVSQPEPTVLGEETMDFTMAAGGIQHGRVSDVSHLDPDGNEDMSMEFTTAVGGLLSGGFSNSVAPSTRRQTIAAEDDDDGDLMDMTMGVGRILPAEAEEEDGDQTMGMDMTMPVGGIIKPAPTPEARSAARKVMEQEADDPDHPMTASPERRTSPRRQVAPMADENANPNLAPFQGKGLRRTPPRAAAPAAPSPAQPSSSPMRQTPSPQRTAQQTRRSPRRTPPSVFGDRSSSPMRNLSSPVRATQGSPAKLKLFHQDPSTGLSTPRVILTPQGRRLSGVGADRSGLGSPRVAEIFDRRESIGEAATSFVPSQPTNPRRNVAFADPRELEAEIDKERQDEQEKEDGWHDANGSQDDREGTPNLMEMIQGLSPKKNPFRGRKSLHVGSALGLLGKRPVELDDEDDEEEPDGVKRLKGHQGSPVKNIRLQSPPSKAETTTGRKTRPSMRPAEPANADSAAPTVTSSPHRASTPKGQSWFRYAGNDQPTATFDFDNTVPMDQAEMQYDDDGERIHLQDFLNMTSIRFMELTTTKRRHTVAPGTSRASTAADDKDDLSLENCVVAGACTIPMLELYQHVSDTSPRVRFRGS